MFINDLEEFLRYHDFDYLNISNYDAYNYLTLMIILYADDTALLANSKEQLQIGLDALGLYCEKWKLKINAEKSKITVFEKRCSVAQNEVLTINGEPIEIVSHFSYLGVTLSSNGSMKKCIEIALERGRKAMFGLLRKSRKLQLNIQTQIDLFHKLVLPVIAYGSEIWAYEDLSKLDGFHLKFLRFILCLNTSTPIPMIYGETGELPISIRIRSRLLGYFAKLTDRRVDSISKRIFELQCKMHNDDYYTTNWLLKVRSMLVDMGAIYVLDDNVMIPKGVMSQVYILHTKRLSL